MVQALSADTRRRIGRHIANLGNADEPVARKAESRLLRSGKKAVRQLLEVVSSDNPQVRLRAVYLLGKSGDEQVFPVILRLVCDPDEHVRYDAVMSLGYLGDPHAIPVLEEIAKHREDPACVASAACMALAKFGISREPSMAKQNAVQVTDLNGKWDQE